MIIRQCFLEIERVFVGFFVLFFHIHSHKAPVLHRLINERETNTDVQGLVELLHGLVGRTEEC